MSSKQYKTEYTSAALDIPYIKKLVFSLNIIGCWPHDVIGEKKWFSNFRNSKLLFTLYSMSFTTVVTHLYKNSHSFSLIEMGRNLINVLMAFISVQRFTTPWSKMYKKMAKDFFLKFHLFYHKDTNDFTMKTYNEVEKISTYVCYLLHIELLSGVILFNLTPLYNNYRSGMFKSVKPENATYDHACFYDLPFDYTTKFNGYLFVFICNWLITFDVAATVCIIDLYIFVILIHLWGHIKILKYNLINVPRPEMKYKMNSRIFAPWYSAEESLKVTKFLIDSLEHYKMIKEFMNDVCMVFSTTICTYLAFHQICLCILLMEISEMNTEVLGLFGVLTVTLFQQLIQVSIIFELIGSQSETIKDALYDVPWECMDVKNRKIVLLYLCSVQNPMRMKALGMVPVGVKTMATILKTSISYFMLLRTSASNHS